jgi:hypothetical protein
VCSSFSVNDICSQWVIPKSKMAVLDTFFVPGPFTVELNADWQSLYTFLSREAKCSPAFLAFNATGGNNVILTWTRQHQIEKHPSERI